MKALFEFEFEPKTFIDDETLKNNFHNDWNEYIKWQYEQEGFGIFTNDATFVKVIADEENNMPTNDNTPTIESILEHINKKGYTGGDLQVANDIQNLIDRARLDELRDYSQMCGILRVEPTTRGLKDRIKALEAKIKGGE